MKEIEICVRYKLEISQVQDFLEAVKPWATLADINRSVERDAWRHIKRETLQRRISNRYKTIMNHLETMEGPVVKMGVLFSSLNTKHVYGCNYKTFQRDVLLLGAHGFLSAKKVRCIGSGRTTLVKFEKPYVVGDHTPKE